MSARCIGRFLGHIEHDDITGLYICICTWSGRRLHLAIAVYAPTFEFLIIDKKKEKWYDIWDENVNDSVLGLFCFISLCKATAFGILCCQSGYIVL